MQSFFSIIKLLKSIKYCLILNKGLTCPTSGTVLIDGCDLSTNLEEARRSLGLCPQKDMLFNDLTTFQILKFYGVVRICIL
mgnify:FL=1